MNGVSAFTITCLLGEQMPALQHGIGNVQLCRKEKTFKKDSSLEGTSKNVEVPAAHSCAARDRARQRLIGGGESGPAPDSPTRKTDGTTVFRGDLEGFEGIRAQDILPLALQKFGFDFFHAYGNVIDPFVDRSFGPHSARCRS